MRKKGSLTLHFGLKVVLFTLETYETYTLNSVTGSGHVKFGKDLPGQSSCHLYMAFQLLKNQASGHYKSQKRDWPCTLPVTPMRV